MRHIGRNAGCDGAVTVFALPDGLPIYVDEGLMPLPYVILGGGSRSTKVKIAPEVFTRLPGATIVAGLSIVSEPSSPRPEPPGGPRAGGR